MKPLKFFAALTLLFAMASCSVNKPLYSWGRYEHVSYNYLKNQDDKSVQDLLKTYETLIKNQDGSRQTVPPGVYADYGFLLLQLNKVEEGKAMLAKEVELYPESAALVERILKMTEK